MMWRMTRALEARTIDDPELLPQVIALAQRLAEVVNVAGSGQRRPVRHRPAPRRVDGRMRPVLGISKQSASERRHRGAEAIDARVTAAGAVRFAEAHRERAAIDAAADYAVANLAEWRARRAA